MQVRKTIATKIATECKTTVLKTQGATEGPQMTSNSNTGKL